MEKCSRRGFYNLQISSRRNLLFIPKQGHSVFGLAHISFAFDAINASVQLQNGVASTHDFKMRGLNATVLMEGSANVAQETQNLRVLVLPEINAAGASVMYALLANPAIGLGTFLAQMVLREPLAKAFSYEYQVTGSWDDPQVSKAEKNTPKPVTEK